MSIRPTIRCDKFEIVEQVDGDSLGIRLETDLPPDTTIMVGVSRSYRELGEPNVDYSIDYLAEKSTVAAWSQMKYISISDAVWESSLKAKQREMASYGLGFRVASTDEMIDIRFVVPVNQLNPQFDENNLNLSGLAVEGTRLKHCRAEKSFVKPLRHSEIMEAATAVKGSCQDKRTGLHLIEN